MTEIDRVLRRASLRLLLERLLRALVVSLLAAGVVVVGARLGERLLAWTPDWMLVWTVAVGAGCLAAIVWTLVTRRTRLGVARVVDERANLKEALSTALCVAGSDDPWSHAARDHAREVSRRVVMRDVAPVRAPRGWFMPLLALGAFFALGLVPQQDLLGTQEKARKEEAVRQDLIAAQEQEKEAEDLLAKIDSMLGMEDDTGSPEPPEPNPVEPTTPEEVRREAMSKLTSAQERLDQLQNGEKAQSLEQMKSLMEQLRQPGQGPLDEMSKALQQGDFSKAKEALEELAKQLTSGELSEEQKAALAEQLASLSEQLEKLAAQEGELERKLEQLGLDKKLALDPAALEEALQSLQNLTPEQRESLQKMCQSNAQSRAMCQNMAGACSGGAGGAGGELNLDELAKLSNQLGELDEQSKQMAMAALQQAQLAAAMKQLGQQMGSQGSMAMASPGNNIGPGIGAGKGNGQGDDSPVNFNTEKTKAKNLASDTNIMLGSEFAVGGQVRGESREQFEQAVRAASESASQEIGTNQVPREFHEAVKRYFGALEEAAKSPAPQPAPTPADDADD